MYSLKQKHSHSYCIWSIEPLFLQHIPHYSYHYSYTRMSIIRPIYVACQYRIYLRLLLHMSCVVHRISGLAFHLHVYNINHTHTHFSILRHPRHPHKIRQHQVVNSSVCRRQYNSIHLSGADSRTHITYTPLTVTQYTTAITCMNHQQTHSINLK